MDREIGTKIPASLLVFRENYVLFAVSPAPRTPDPVVCSLTHDLIKGRSDFSEFFRDQIAERKIVREAIFHAAPFIFVFGTTNSFRDIFISSFVVSYRLKFSECYICYILCGIEGDALKRNA